MTSVVYGAGVPTATDGVVGGFYVDTNNGNIYGKKIVGGAWPYAGNISNYINDSLVSNPLANLWESFKSLFSGVDYNSSWMAILVIAFFVLLLLFFFYRRYYLVV